MDIALQQLLPHLVATRGNVLWLADEHVDRSMLTSLPQLDHVRALTNRCDVATALRTHGVDTALSDFDFTDLPLFDAILFRVAKEKPLVHHAINCALEHLTANGALWLSGYKNDGIKTYLEKAAARAHGSLQLERHGAALVGTVTKSAPLGDPLDDQQYAQLRQLDFSSDFSANSKPGIFGWQKIDAGSAFLIEHLSTVWPQPPKRVLDLGCGYGYLSLMAARQWPHAQFVGTDNNIAAVHASAVNFEQATIDATAICSDAGDIIRESFDAIICNPPFHQGFAVDGDLTIRFLRAIKRLLTRRGKALLVVNQFIALEREATPLFGAVNVVARNRSYKLVALEH